MLQTTLRRFVGFFIMTLPTAKVDQNHLNAGSKLFIEIIGDEFEAPTERTRLKLADMLKATPMGLCRVKDWDELGTAGAEL